MNLISFKIEIRMRAINIQGVGGFGQETNRANFYDTLGSGHNLHYLNFAPNF